MNNDISVRTNKGEYTLGDTVYGAVYLHICAPTEGTGIKITFKGTEKCNYEKSNECFEDNFSHVEYRDVVLYSQDEYFMYGAYVFPFKFDLPKEIAGTFQSSGTCDEKMSTWKVDVIYTITAYVTGASSVKAIQPVVVYQAKEKDMQDSHLGTAGHTSFQIPRFLLSNQDVHITVKLLQNFVESGKNIQLRVVITNPSKEKVTGVAVRVSRNLRLNFRGSKLKRSLVSEFVEKDCVISPDGDSHIVNTLRASFSSFMGNGDGGIDKLQVPLVERIGRETKELPPSVHGKHVMLEYSLEMSFTFSNQHEETLRIAVPGVLPKKNKQWLEWKPPDWAYNCEIKLHNSLFSLPQHMLHSGVLSGLPMFQVL